MSSDETIEKLRKLDTACLCDAEKALSLGLRVMSSDLRPIRDGLKLVGLAHTVRCHDDFLTVIKALRDAQAGEVIVIDSQNSTRALTGELFPTEAMRKGLAGIVNDGPCRDTVIVREMEIPYYARSVCCIPGRTNKLFETQIPIICGGVTVNPGDLIVGDDDGLIVGTENEFLQLKKCTGLNLQNGKTKTTRKSNVIKLLLTAHTLSLGKRSKSVFFMLTHTPVTFLFLKARDFVL